jgi:deoxyribonuclease (pyrimidine dimer)
MVRVNIVNPKYLTDQHLIAEYLEILMLVGYVRKYPKAEDIPDNYCLGKGHIKFFKNKLEYLKKRHESIRKEMKKRGFATNVKLNISDLPKALRNDWKPRKSDIGLIKNRISWKIKKKPGYYRYCGKKLTQKKLNKIIGKSTA